MDFYVPYVYHQGSSPDEGDLGPWYPSAAGSGMNPMVAAAGISAISGMLGQRSANRANAALAQRQMDFQERMSSTSFQRAVADMKAAGVNPMLAAKLGGASSPSGASAVMQNEAKAGVEAGFSAAQQYRMNKLMDLELEKFGEEVNLLKTQQKVNSAQAAATEADAYMKGLGPAILEELTDMFGSDVSNVLGVGAKTGTNVLGDIVNRLMDRFSKKKGSGKKFTVIND